MLRSSQPEVLAHNGVLILASVSGSDSRVEVNAVKINIDLVVGNKLMAVEVP